MTRKLDKEHLDSIQDLQTNFAQVANILGNIAIETHIAKKQLEQLESEHEKYVQKFEMLQQQEEDLIARLKERYGEGQIDIQAGTFTSAE
jgi:predicted transcriptional regulator